MQFERILVAYDGSPAAQLALQSAIRLEVQDGGRLRLILKSPARAIGREVPAVSTSKGIAS